MRLVKRIVLSRSCCWSRSSMDRMVGNDFAAGLADLETLAAG